MKRSFVVFGLMALALSACSYETQEPNKGLCGVGVDDKELGKANICECAENVTEKCDAIVLGQGNHLSDGHWKCDTTTYAYHKCVAECDGEKTFHQNTDGDLGCFEGAQCTGNDASSCPLEWGAASMRCEKGNCVIGECYEGLGPKGGKINQCACPSCSDDDDDCPYLIYGPKEYNKLEIMEMRLGNFCKIKGCKGDYVSINQYGEYSGDSIIECVKVEDYCSGYGESVSWDDKEHKCVDNSHHCDNGSWSDADNGCICSEADVAKLCPGFDATFVKKFDKNELKQCRTCRAKECKPLAVQEGDNCVCHEDGYTEVKNGECVCVGGKYAIHGCTDEDAIVAQWFVDEISSSWDFMNPSPELCIEAINQMVNFMNNYKDNMKLLENDSFEYYNSNNMYTSEYSYLVSYQRVESLLNSCYSAAGLGCDTPSGCGPDENCPVNGNCEDLKRFAKYMGKLCDYFYNEYEAQNCNDNFSLITSDASNI